MNAKVEWTCHNCDTPNVITMQGGRQYALSCTKCGAPGQSPKFSKVVDDGVPMVRMVSRVTSTCVPNYQHGPLNWTEYK